MRAGYRTCFHALYDEKIISFSLGFWFVSLYQGPIDRQQNLKKTFTITQSIKNKQPNMNKIALNKGTNISNIFNS